jgi:hypothetical protein
MYNIVSNTWRETAFWSELAGTWKYPQRVRCIPKKEIVVFDDLKYIFPLNLKILRKNNMISCLLNANRQHWASQSCVTPNRNYFLRTETGHRFRCGQKTLPTHSVNVNVVGLNSYWLQSTFTEYQIYFQPTLTLSVCFCIL